MNTSFALRAPSFGLRLVMSALVLGQAAMGASAAHAFDPKDPFGWDKTLEKVADDAPGIGGLFVGGVGMVGGGFMGAKIPLLPPPARVVTTVGGAVIGGAGGFYGGWVLGEHIADLLRSAKFARWSEPRWANLLNFFKRGDVTAERKIRARDKFIDELAKRIQKQVLKNQKLTDEQVKEVQKQAPLIAKMLYVTAIQNVAKDSQNGNREKGDKAGTGVLKVGISVTYKVNPDCKNFNIDQDTSDPATHRFLQDYCLQYEGESSTAEDWHAPKEIELEADPIQPSAAASSHAAGAQSAAPIQNLPPMNYDQQ